MIRISNLSKRFGEIQAVDGLTFSVKKGELCAFLGVNGAGKSTTISMICAQLTPDSGSIEINGLRDIFEARRMLGVVFQSSVLDMPLSVKDNLASRAALYGISGKKFEERLSELDELVGLSDILKRPVGKLSGGQKRRADIARALIHTPDVLILDEPTSGLDPQTRRTIWEVIGRLRRETGMTVMFSTHYMEEAADAEHVVVIDQGKLVAEGTPMELKNRYSGDYITLYGASEADVAGLGLKYQALPGAVRLEVPSTGAATALIVAHPELFRDYEIVKGRMDDVFLAVTGKKLGGEA